AVKAVRRDSELPERRLHAPPGAERVAVGPNLLIGIAAAAEERTQSAAQEAAGNAAQHSPDAGNGRADRCSQGRATGAAEAAHHLVTARELRQHAAAHEAEPGRAE